MSSINHVLVPTDGSEGSLKSAAFAAGLAGDTGARITLAIVHPEELLTPYAWAAGEWPVVPSEAQLSMDEIRARVEQSAKDEELAKTRTALGDISGEIVEVQLWGHAAEELCRYAVDNKVDLIVMGTRGHSSFGRLLLGSVSTQVANHATCPVTLVR